MGKIKDKVFGLVVSKNVTDSLADSVKEGNQAKFYLAQDKLPNGSALDDVTSPDELTDRNVLIINGNKIQGVNQNDLSKLDAITDVGKLFKYKGSVKTGDDLKAKVPPEAEVGDVWNVEAECEIGGVKYPAHTNFVCSEVKVSIDGKPATSTWDSLGGTMQMGTKVFGKVNSNEDTITFINDNKIPISEFAIGVDKNVGLSFTKNTRLTLNLATNCSYKSIPNYLSINSLDHHPLNGFSIPVGGGIASMNTVSNYDKVELSLQMSTIYTNLSMNDKASLTRVSGLSIDTYGGLFVALASAKADSQYIPAALDRIPSRPNTENSGGLIIDGTQIVNWLVNKKALDAHINSLIDAKLKAQ